MPEESFEEFDGRPVRKPVAPQSEDDNDFPIGPEELLQIDVELPNLGKKVKHDLFNTLHNKALEDPFSLNEEMNKAPVWYAYYGTLSAEADFALSEAEEEYDEWYALAYEVAKDYLDGKYDKVTETMIKTTIPGLFRESANWFIATGEYDETAKEYLKEEIRLVSFKEARQKKREAEKNANVMKVYAKSMQFKIGLLPSQLSLARSLLENPEMRSLKRNKEGAVSSAEATISKETTRSK
ncbi:MAG: hypothetical protein WC479_05470 [Candidatus Izemoplasmatales bacterium]|jgi:hypothetical protein